MKQMEFTILGQGYILGCEEGGEVMLKAAAETVDREMSGIRDGGKIKARERIAVLAALNLAYRLAQKADPAADTPATGTAPAHRDAPPALSDIEVDGLVRQLDAALGADGHLL
ncbi:MAG: cell division protein ZapA [Rubrivivax sp.]